MIVWYLRRCGGTFHNCPYGENGKYIVMMSDKKYNEYQKL